MNFDCSYVGGDEGIFWKLNQKIMLVIFASKYMYLVVILNYIHKICLDVKWKTKDQQLSLYLDLSHHENITI